MNSFLDPVGARPPAVYWRRRALFAAALAMVTLLAARACSSGGPPDLGAQTSAPGPVPLVSTYTPTPSASGKTSPAEKIIDGGDDALPGFHGSGGAAGSGGSITTAQGDAAEDPLAGGVADGAVAAGGGSGGAASGPGKPLGTAKPAPKATPKPTPVPTKVVVTGPQTCRATNLAVTVRADARRYASSKAPRFFLGVQNTGKKSCLVDLGSGALSLTVVSGKDRVWSSDDCQGKATKDVRLLEAGQKLEARSIWSMVRSEPGCPKGLDTARPGTYVVSGSAGGVKAERRIVFQIV